MKWVGGGGGFSKAERICEGGPAVSKLSRQGGEGRSVGIGSGGGGGEIQL